MMRYVSLVTVLLLLVTTGCGLLGSPEEDLSGPAITTVEEEFTATVTSERIELAIPFTFANRSDQDVYVPVCKWPHPPTLEKRVQGVWITVYSLTVLLCQDVPLTIGAGAEHHGSLFVGLFRGTNFHPYFHPGEVGGSYRLVWDVFTRKDGRDLSGLLPLEKRASNTFTIE